MKSFKQDPGYLLRYCWGTVGAFAAADVLLALIRAGSAGGMGLSLSPADAILPVLALLLCGLPSSLLHNAAHGNVGAKTFNRLVGEACGTIMLYGFEGFRIGHVFHHKYPDHPRLDPHPPRGLSFPRFLVAPVKATLAVIETAYFDAFGRTPATVRRIAAQKVLFQLGFGLKLLFWLLLLGPKGFLLFYLPMYFANIFVFAHINYATHIEREDGFAEIVDLDHTGYYRLINRLSFGGYLHKSHHLRPKAFNPARVRLPAGTRPLLTYGAPRAAALREGAGA